MAEALVHALFESETRGLDEMLEVIYSYAHFVTAEALLDALSAHFCAISSSQSKPQGETIMLRIINFLKNWIKVEQKLFLSDPALDASLKQFLQVVPPKWVPLLEMALNDAAQVEESDGDLTEQKPPLLTRKASKTTFSVITITILNYDAEEIARQLVLIDLQYCQKVDPKEFLNLSWTKPDSTSLGLNECAVRANAVAYWVAQQVLTCPTLKARVKLLTHILLICQALLKYQNFQSLMSFYLGLNLGPVEDLELFSNLPKNVAEIWRDIKFLFDVANNFRNYRQKIKSINLPYILCLEILLKDLLFLEESQADFIDDIFGRFVNQEKMHTIGKTIHSFVKSQRCSYGLSDYADLQSFLRTSPDMSELLTSLNSIELKVNLWENRTKEPSLMLTKPPEPSFGPPSPNSGHFSSLSGEDSSLHIEEMKNLSPTNSSRITSPWRPRSIKALFSDAPTSPRRDEHLHPPHILERSFTTPSKSRSPMASPKLNSANTNTNSMSDRTESCEEEDHQSSKSGVVTRIRSRSLSSRSKGKNNKNVREANTVNRSSPLSYTTSSASHSSGTLPSRSRPLSASMKDRCELERESASDSPKERASNNNSSPEAEAKRRERSKKKLARDDSERGSEKERVEPPKKASSSSKPLSKRKSDQSPLDVLGVKKLDGKSGKLDDGK